MNSTSLKPFLIGAGILAVGVIGLLALVALRTEAPRIDPPRQSPLVMTIKPTAQEGHLAVRGNGTVRPIHEIDLIAEVAGKVVSVSDALVSGGFFQQGDTLLQIDPADYENAVSVAEAEVTQRHFELLMAQQEVEVAREEWARLERRTGVNRSPDSTALGSLVFKEPQRKAAVALLKSAEARLDDAQTRLARTRITAPFTGRVRAKIADIGQYVGPGQAVASIYSADAVEIVVPLSSRDAALLADLWTPESRRGRGPRLPATVTVDFGGQRYEWEGSVERIEGALNEATRTVNVVVRVAHPYQTKAGWPPLMVGTFTTVILQGMALDRYYVLPRDALREGDTVWVVEDEILYVRPVEVIQEVDEEIYVTSGITENDAVVTSTLSVMTDGMSVRVAGN